MIYLCRYIDDRDTMVRCCSVSKAFRDAFRKKLFLRPPDYFGQIAVFQSDAHTVLEPGVGYHVYDQCDATSTFLKKKCKDKNE